MLDSDQTVVQQLHQVNTQIVNCQADSEVEVVFQETVNDADSQSSALINSPGINTQTSRTAANVRHCSNAGNTLPATQVHMNSSNAGKTSPAINVGQASPASQQGTSTSATQPHVSSGNNFQRLPIQTPSPHAHIPRFTLKPNHLGPNMVLRDLASEDIPTIMREYRSRVEINSQDQCTREEIDRRAIKHLQLY